MFCPECRSEYREGFTACVDCEVALIPALPLEDHQGEPLVTVFAEVDPGRLALAYSLLHDAGIPYFEKGESLQDLLDFGRIAGFSAVAGPVQVQVPESQAKEARELLEDLESAEPSAMLEELE